MDSDTPLETADSVTQNLPSNDTEAPDEFDDEMDEDEEDQLEWDTTPVPSSGKRVFVFSAHYEHAPGRKLLNFLTIEGTGNVGLCVILDPLWTMEMFLDYLKGTFGPIKQVFLLVGNKKAEVRNIGHFRDDDRILVSLIHTPIWAPTNSMITPSLTKNQEKTSEKNSVNFPADKLSSSSVNAVAKPNLTEEEAAAQRKEEADLLGKGITLPLRFTAETQSLWSKTPKSILQEWSQRVKKNIEWKMLYNNMDKYLAQVTIESKVYPFPNFFSGQAKEAEHNASIPALLELTGLDKVPSVTPEQLSNVILPLLKTTSKKKKRKRESHLWVTGPDPKKPHLDSNSSSNPNQLYYQSSQQNFPGMYQNYYGGSEYYSNYPSSSNNQQPSSSQYHQHQHFHSHQHHNFHQFSHANVPQTHRQTQSNLQNSSSIT